MKDGYIQQIGTPQDIYNEPANAFVADFIGESNIMDGLMYDDFKVQFAGNEFECVDKGFGQMKRVDVVSGLKTSRSLPRMRASSTAWSIRSSSKAFTLK